MLIGLLIYSLARNQVFKNAGQAKHEKQMPNEMRRH
jgi:hypothetical protein